MIASIRIIALAIIASASSAFANTPPIPPPEPARLAAAERLVAALPLEAAVGDGFGTITWDVANNAVAWLAIQPLEGQDETLKSVFYEKVRTESRTRITAAIGDARASLSDLYARQLSERDLKSAENFAVTDEGKAFLLVQLSGDVGLRNLVSRFMYERTFPDLPRILQSSRESSEILKGVNRKR